MSSKKIQELVDEIISLGWSDEEESLFLDFLSCYNYSSKFASSSTKTNIIGLLEMVKNMKIQLEYNK